MMTTDVATPTEEKVEVIVYNVSHIVTPLLDGRVVRGADFGSRGAFYSGFESRRGKSTSAFF